MWDYVRYTFNLFPKLIIYYTDLPLYVFASWCIYLDVTRARACVMHRMFVCVRTMAYMLVVCTLLCSVVGALVFAAGCRCFLGVHFAAVVFARGRIIFIIMREFRWNYIIIMLMYHLLFYFTISMLRYFAHLHILWFAKLAYYFMIYACSFIWRLPC